MYFIKAIAAAVIVSVAAALLGTKFVKEREWQPIDKQAEDGS